MALRALPLRGVLGAEGAGDEHRRGALARVTGDGAGRSAHDADLAVEDVGGADPGDDAGGIQFEPPDTSDVLTVGAYAGAAMAMEKLADFYLKRADQVLGLGASGLGACGLALLKAIHLNDSKKELGSRVDRHEHIGQGLLGLEPFRLLVLSYNLPRDPDSDQVLAGLALEERFTEVVQQLIRERARLAELIAARGGIDRLGADVFVFRDGADADRITDFDPSVGDRIDLSGLSAFFDHGLGRRPFVDALEGFHNLGGIMRV